MRYGRRFKTIRRSVGSTPTTWSRSTTSKARAGTTRGCSRTGRSRWTRRPSCCTTPRKCSKGSRPTAGLTANEYRYLVIASPAGAYFKGGIKPVSVWLSTEYVRACPGGTGAAKFGGNYAASLLAQAQAIENECDQVVWLDAVERRYVEEMGGMNLFFVFGSGGTARLVTPELSGSILPGVTRDALLQLATDAGFAVEERKIDVDEWQKKAAAGEITEVFACGTAAVITPVAHVKYGDGEFTVADGGPGEITMALRDTLTCIQRGTFADTHGWMARLS